MVLFTSIVCMILVYYYLDSGLALGFAIALVIEIFFLMGLYNVLKKTEEKAKFFNQKKLDELGKTIKEKEKYINKIKEIHPDIDLQIKSGGEKKETEEEIEAKEETERETQEPQT